MKTPLVGLARQVPGAHAARKAADVLGWRLRLSWTRYRGETRIALSSYPRSGNTWLRFFIEAATGELTGTVGHRPSRVLSRGQEGVVIKTHRLDGHKYTHAIHLVRSPFDVLDSYFEWQKALGWSWKYGELTWDQFVLTFAVKWKAHARYWMDWNGDALRIRYEDCRRDPVQHFSRLLNWMGRDLSEERIRKAVEDTSFTNLKKAQSAESPFGDKFFRRGQVNRGIERFSEHQREWMVRLLERELVECGYADLIETAGSRRA